jgi:hypothetical protein
LTEITMEKPLSMERTDLFWGFLYRSRRRPKLFAFWDLVRLKGRRSRRPVHNLGSLSKPVRPQNGASPGLAFLCWEKGNCTQRGIALSRDQSSIKRCQPET